MIWKLSNAAFAKAARPLKYIMMGPATLESQDDAVLLRRVDPAK
jgi:hypothetical protein